MKIAFVEQWNIKVWTKFPDVIVESRAFVFYTLLPPQLFHDTSIFIMCTEKIIAQIIKFISFFNFTNILIISYLKLAFWLRTKKEHKIPSFNLSTGKRSRVLDVNIVQQIVNNASFNCDGHQISESSLSKLCSDVTLHSVKHCYIKMCQVFALQCLAH